MLLEHLLGNGKCFVRFLKLHGLLIGISPNLPVFFSGHEPISLFRFWRSCGVLMDVQLNSKKSERKPENQCNPPPEDPLRMNLWE
jgi:hypothetical protein